MGVGIHLAIRFPVLSQQFYMHLGESTVIGFLLVPLLLEALRRTTGWGLVSVVALFVLYGLFADHVPGQLQGRAIVPMNFVPFVAIDSTAIFGTPLQVVANIVIVYVLFGNLLTVTGGSAGSPTWRSPWSAAAAAARPRSPSSPRPSSARSRAAPWPMSSRQASSPSR